MKTIYIVTLLLRGTLKETRIFDRDIENVRNEARYMVRQLHESAYVDTSTFGDLLQNNESIRSWYSVHITETEIDIEDQNDQS